jgi:hypothetical protein
MAANVNPTTVPIEPRRVSDGIRANIRGRHDYLIPRNSLYRRMYSSSSRIGVNYIKIIYKKKF